LIQRESVPSAIDSPIWGMITSIRAIGVLQSRVASRESRDNPDTDRDS
jgi:hypothetical protein